MLVLSFAGSHEPFSVRRFSVREGLSQLFDISVVALSPDSDLDLDAVVGRPASFRMTSGLAHGSGVTRVWDGICSLVEQVRAEPHGLSTYHVRVVPAVWMLTQRRGYRVFQHATIPEIVAKILAEWGIPATWRIDRGAYPKLEYRVAYDETDFAFLSRMLEEAGISYYFENDDDGGTQLVFADEPQACEPRRGGPIRYVDNPNQSAELELLTDVRVVREVGPGRLTLRGFDFRRKVDVPLHVEAPRTTGPEEQLEHQVYAPGAFVAADGRGEGARVADGLGVVQADERHGKIAATRMLDSERGPCRRVTYRTNVTDLAPGTTFSLSGHAREDLGPACMLLVTELHIEGELGAEWTLRGSAARADRPYRPLRRTLKPHVSSVQSAVVVGPRSEDIHTDELGRVRVQFHWDREGQFDARSSCWIRVSQGWAGGGFGMLMLPRVGHEVVVGFFEGDPDQPVIVGRLFNGGSVVPQKLPEQSTVSVLRTATSPANGGYNELRFDDALGAELVHVQAERDLTKNVKLNETETTGGERVLQVGERLTLTTGHASIILDGGDISIRAEGNIDIRSDKGLWLNDQEEDDAPPSERGPQVEGDVAHYAQGIDVKGTSDFRARVAGALDALARTRTGARLLGKIASTGKTVTILVSSMRNAACRAHDPASARRRPNGKHGRGSSSTVTFNPDLRPAGASAEALLAFALAQARLNALGLRESNTPRGPTEPGRSAPPQSYRNVLLVENEIRRQLGVPERRDY